MTEQTKNFETVEVGLWYQTKAGFIVNLIWSAKGKVKNELYPFLSNAGHQYNENGKVSRKTNHPHDLIRCLGADPFKSDNERDLLEMLHYTEHGLPKPKEMCERFAYITVVQHKDGTFGHSYSGMMPSAVAAKVITGQDPFQQVDISKTDTTISKMETVAPTQFERILTALLSGFSQNHLFDEPKDFIAYAIKATQEAIKQLKEIEGA